MQHADRHVQLHLFVSPEERERAHDLASMLGTTVSQMMRDFIAEEHARLTRPRREARARR